jgi:hypothetical protein
MTKASKIILALIICLALAACATFQDLTPEGKYLSALKWYNDNLEEYLDAYDRASPATQEKWNQDIKPLFVQAGELLNLWEAGTAGITEGDWLKIRNQIIAALITHELIVVEGE